MSDDDERARLLDALSLLEALAGSRERLDVLGDELRRRFIVAAGQLSRPEREDLRRERRARRRGRALETKRKDEVVLSATGIRALRRAAVFVTPPLLPLPSEDDVAKELVASKKCYVCKASFTEVHHFYDQLCPPCAALNFERRHRSADLRGRVALVTGARVKIGYQAAIKLLRAGAKVIVTTRFPHDAATRFEGEEDYASWRDRLVIHGLDLRHTPSVEAFCDHLNSGLDRLDFIINNACQTVRRPSGFYRHLMDAERAAEVNLFGSATEAPATRDEALALFVDGELDQDRQQIDRRELNSWRLKLDEVPTIELLEVHLVNAVAPYVLNGRLRALMNRTSEQDKHIVNVSAMEGQFYREWKTDRHPHTNMAKAALNMMTRTSAVDYVKDGIHMNSVDTGWITDEDPLAIAEVKVAVHGFHPPLDIVDGAARIVDPIFDGFATGEHAYGQFLKDYRPIPW